MTQTVLDGTRMEVVRLAGNIGGEVKGVDTGDALSDETVAAVRQAILKHKVVFLRNQHLDYPRQVTFGKRLGDLTLGHPIFPNIEAKPYLREFDSRHGTRANHWHTDLTFLDRPPRFGLLHSVVVPPVGGDTIWANTVTAYESLPAELRELADRLRIVHSNDSDYTDDTVDKLRAEYITNVFEAEHPAVQVHPETGERSLLLGGFARRVVGFTPQGSRDLIRLLQEYVTKPEQTVRWKWRVGDLVIWDNFGTSHYAVCDYGVAHRRNERVTVAGTVPIGVDGRPSRSLRGEASTFHTGRS